MRVTKSEQISQAKARDGGDGILFISISCLSSEGLRSKPF